MVRTHLQRNILLFLAVAAWVFLFLALGSFHATDWPSHAVYPYQPIQNLCGSVGSFVAYWMFVVLGQGVYPLLFFSGACLAALILRNQVTDIWLRLAGLVILCTAVSAFVHHFAPGSSGGLPEGQGGFVGISTAAFLQAHFSTVGTRLVLLTAIIVGLLLAADDLLLHTPAMVAAAAATVRNTAKSKPKWTWGTAARASWDLTKGLIASAAGALRQTNSASATKPAKTAPKRSTVEDEEDDLKPPVLLKREAAPAEPAAVNETVKTAAADTDEPARRHCLSRPRGPTSSSSCPAPINR
jgi:hypothetical protein